MVLSLLRGDPEIVIHWYRPMLLAAMVGGYLALKFEIPGIFLSCYFLGSMGAAGGMLTNYRSEPGLWLLAGLFLLIFGGLDILFAFNEFKDNLQNMPQLPIGIAFDLTLGTTLLAAQVRFLWRVVKVNQALSTSE